MKTRVLLTIAALLALPIEAQAGVGTKCGSSPAGTNVPNGAVFLSSGAGPVLATLSAVGEARSHSGISHGNGWYTHSTMYEPQTRDWDDSETSCGVFGDYCCQGPLKGSQLQNGYPGSSQINGGGLYAFYYLNGAAVNFFYYQRSMDPNYNVDTRGASVANWLWNSSNYAWVGTGGFYRVGFTGVTPYAQYSFYQYRDYQNINNGSVPWNYGDVCSTTMAYAQQQSGMGVVNNTRSHNQVAGVVNSYDHTYVVAGLNALYNAVKQDCDDGSDLLHDIGAALTCWEDICDDAARQVANCFSDGIHGHCYDDSDTWKGIRDNRWPSGPVDGNGYSITKSVSPDNIGGWGGWGWGSTPGASVWSRDGNQGVAWNSGGSVYGCFF